MTRQDEVGDLLYKVLSDDPVTKHNENKAYIVDILSKALVKAGYVLPVPDSERRAKVLSLMRNPPKTTFAATGGVYLTYEDTDWQAVKKELDSILRLPQPTLPLKRDTELVLFIHNYIKGGGTLPGTQDMEGWSQVVEALDEYVRQIQLFQPPLPETPKEITDLLNKIIEISVNTYILRGGSLEILAQKASFCLETLRKA